jgi:leucyl aminopeptidase
MEIAVKIAQIEKEPCEALIVGVPQDTASLHLPSPLQEAINQPLEKGDFRGKPNETLVVYTQSDEGPKRLCLVGLGEWEKFSLDSLRRAVGSAARHVMNLGVRSCSVALDLLRGEKYNGYETAQAAVEGAVLGTYQSTEFKELEPDQVRNLDRVDLLLSNPDQQAGAEDGARWGRIVADSVCFSRDLQNHPGNVLTPSRLAEEAEKLAKDKGLACQVLTEKEAQELGMGAFLAVAKGSQQPPRFIILEHKPEGASSGPYVFVGKGVTFDSGGISIKPSSKMEEMKFDMSGAAAVLGALAAVADLDMPVHVVGLIPATENLPSGTALKPGDIVRASNGKTIEIINTDAEGRLILADALVYAKKYEPAAVIDLATLTGACVVALGQEAAGLFGNDETLVDQVKQAGEQTGERCWPLPLWDEYDELIKSDYADVKNSGGRWAGAITAAAFLKKFVEGYSWVHLDIAGTAYLDKDRPTSPRGGAGVGVRLLVQFLRNALLQRT